MVQHLPVPLLQSLGLWDLLVGRVAVENVVVAFARWTRPDVALRVPECGTRGTTRLCVRIGAVVLPRTRSAKSSDGSAFRSSALPEFLDVFQIADEDLVVHGRPQDPRSEEVNTVQVGYVDSSAHGQKKTRGIFRHVPSHEVNVRLRHSAVRASDGTDLVFGKGHSEPYSCTCMPKKHTSTPSISSKAKSALVL